jgi:glycine betaine transporter
MLAIGTVFTVSSVTGVYRGIRRLSLLTVGGFVVLGLATFVLGPTGYILSVGANATSGYVTDFIMMSTSTGDWAASWTVFYWSWWFSWAPFVGLFIARISKGRTVREVVLIGVGGNSLATITWFLVMGGTAIGLQRNGSADILTAISNAGVAVSGFPLFGELVFGNGLLILFLGLVITFLVTSADTSTLSLAILTTNATRLPSTEVRAVWGGIQVMLAAVLLVGSGGTVVRSAAVLTGGPFALLAAIAMIGMIYTSKTVQRYHP